MKNQLKKIVPVLMIVLMLGVMALPVLADETTTGVVSEGVAEIQAAASTTGTKAIAAAVTIAVVAAAGAIAMALSISKATDGIARQPEAQGAIRTALMLGLVFIETAIIYALIVAILIVFVL
ncbi:MAG: ATP synthase F0 subunit C [Firmicutes bacterium]|nr:ATP synthase F0 subunit C [Bacillota bacterium]